MKEFGKLMLAGLIGGFITLGSGHFMGHDDASSLGTTPVQIKQASLNYSGSSNAVNFDFTEAAALVTPGVVHIKSTVERAYTAQREMPEMPEQFRRFFGPDFFGEGQGQRNYEPQPQIGSGSGVIVSSDGYIVTNNHVVEDASKVEVTLDDNRSFEAVVIGTDPETDMALIKIDASDLRAIKLGNSDDVKVGEWVLAVGNPFNLESTVTAGIVSAMGRSIHIIPGRTAVEAFIQTDAAVNPGNSGGALVNLRGELIGINTAIASPTGAYSGYSFAVPVNLMEKVIGDIKTFGAVQRAFLGVTIREINSDLAKEKDLPVSRGVYVDSLSDNGAAREAGIKSGDIILKVDGQQINSVPALQEAIARHRPGDEVVVIVLRSGKEKELHAHLMNIDGNDKIVKIEKREVLSTLGAEFQDLSGKEKKDLGVDNGVRVKKLYAGKLRSATQMREGFIITRVNKEKVYSADDLEVKLEGLDGGVLIEGIYPGSSDPVYYGFGV